MQHIDYRDLNNKIQDKNKYQRHETHLHLAPWTVGLERINGPGGRELSGYYIRRSFKTGEKRK